MDTTANRADVATRAGVVDGMRTIALRRLPPVLQAVLEKADDALFDFAQGGASSSEQQPFLDAMQEVRRERGTIVQRFTAELGNRLYAPASVDADGNELKLVDSEALEEQLACEQLADAADKPQKENLQRIVGRLNRTFSPPPGDHRWAQQIAESFRQALAPLECQTQARLVLYKLFERRLTTVFGELVGEFDFHLQTLGINTDGIPRPKPVTREPTPAKAEADTTEAKSTASAPTQAAAGEVDPGLFSMLRELFTLQARRLPGAVAQPGVPLLARRATFNVLSRLQRETPPAILMALDDPQLSLADVLRDELVHQAEALGVAPHGAALEPRDMQAISMVGLLFDVLLSHRSYLPDVRRQFLRLSVPYAKAAMLNPRMFALKQHPARRLLDTLAEASEGNLGETAAERDVLGRVDTIVDRLTAEFNEDVAIFAELESEFRAAIELHWRRTQLAEQRAAEAQRGRERLDQARAAAAAELAALVRHHRLPEGHIGTFLREQWPHHLAMVALREGTDGAGYRAALQFGRAFWSCLVIGYRGHEEKLERLRAGMLDVLGSSGQYGEAAGATIEAVFGEMRQSITLQPGETVMAAAPVVAAPAASATPAGNADYDQAAAEIAALAVGDWVEFVEPDGSTIPAKLCWISPMSSNLLFVNKRGLRHCSASRAELAEALRSGTLQLRREGSTFTRAMMTVLERLKQPQPVAA